MDNKKTFLILILTILFITLIGITYNVNAWMPQPNSISIELKNINTKNYIIDLIEYNDGHIEFDYNCVDDVAEHPLKDGGSIDKNGYKVYYNQIAKYRRYNS